MKRLLILALALWPCAVLAQVQQVSIATNIPTYAAADVNIANAGAGDIACIYGSATKTIAVSQLRLSALATSSIVVNTTLVKRSSAFTGGTPVAETNVPYNSANPTATATVTGFTASPTPGTAVGTMAAVKLAIDAPGNTVAAVVGLIEFGNLSDQPVILHGTAEGLCVNSTAAGTGGSWSVSYRWTEY
jgi:hypothetical protein